jgi:hypothetical protein|tara:strand:+ start:425 stop:901 length:477 start_codon:yes stop_codon:yes gene_type:complete
MSIDLDKIKDELKLLPNFKPPFFDQICLQGVEDNSDPFFGCDTIKSLKPYKETDFTELNFDLPYINSIIEELNMYRTRVLILKPKVCYSIHSDPVKRIHIPVITNENCWVIVNKEIMHLPADGRYYEIDTTQKHTALNGSWEDRIHIVGCIDNENISS